jgi:UDP-N-acetylmuramate dehydrogenase
MVGHAMNQNLLNELYRIVGEDNVKLQEPMAMHTTFRIGGPAQYFVMPMDTEELSQVVLLCKAEKVPFFVLGHGSNILVSDKGMSGVVIRLYTNYAGYSVKGNMVSAKAGIMLNKLGASLLEEGLTGFEFAAGIPGTLGGAIVMNAGAYGGEMKDIVKSVSLMDENGNIFKKSCEEMEFAYRHSIVQDKGYIVLGADLMLKEGNKEEIKAKMDELALARKTKQPLEFPSAGSTFKRPEGYFAGKLIMDAGLAGYTVGGAQVSEKHCGFVINKGGATAQDVVTLMDDVKRIVQDKFSVELEPEVKVIGD